MVSAKDRESDEQAVWEFLCGTAGLGSSVFSAAAWVAAVEQVSSLAPELPHAMDVARKKKRAVLLVSEYLFLTSEQQNATDNLSTGEENGMIVFAVK